MIPVQITFRSIGATKDIQDEITARAQNLARFYSGITSCRVLIEVPARHHRNGSAFHVRIDLTVPDSEIVVKREPTLYPSQRDIAHERHSKRMETRPERRHLKVAIREAFDAARRRLQDHAGRRRTAVRPAGG